MNNLYKVSTSYEGAQNFRNFYVSAPNGIQAAAKVNILVFKKRAKKQKEVVEEVEYIAPIEVEVANKEAGKKKSK